MKKVFTSLIAGTCLFTANGARADLNLSNIYADSGVGSSSATGSTSNSYKSDCDLLRYDAEQRDCMQKRVFPAVERNASNVIQIQAAVNNNETNITNNATNITSLQSAVNSSQVQTKSGSTTTTVVGDATRNVLEIGTGTNPTQIHQSGMSVNGQNLISTDANGVTKIGANSLNFQTKNGTENLWGTDASGNSIPLNVTNGSKLLIDGRDVEQAIDNVGALTAALTGLPIVPEDSKLSCGLGTGAHGGNVAVSGGCATKVNERLTMNFAGSLIPTGQEYLGDTENAWSGRAGFLFKLGKINKPTQISMKDKKAMQNKIIELSASNKEMQTSNQELQAKVESFQFANQEMKVSNQELRNLLAMQNERLEKIEQIALANQKDEKTAFSFLKASNLFSSMRSFLISSN